jgi:hypothetical protein
MVTVHRTVGRVRIEANASLGGHLDTSRRRDYSMSGRREAVNGYLVARGVGQISYDCYFLYKEGQDRPVERQLNDPGDRVPPVR